MLQLSAALAMIAIMFSLTDALAALPGDTIAVAAGQTLFHTGDPVRFLYLVQSGGLHLTRFDAEGHAAVMQRATAGMVLAEGSIFSDTYHCDAVAVADSALLRIARDSFQQAVTASPALMEAVARRLAREVQRARIRVEVLAKRTVRERLDAWLALGDGQWPERGTMVSVAQDIGVSPEAFYREMQRRRRLGAA